MKQLNLSLLRLRPLGLACVLLGALSSAAVAVPLAAWDANDNSSWWDPATGNFPIEVYDSNVTVGAFQTHGNVSVSSAYQYIGWSSSFNDANYVGFTVAADEGFKLTLTDFKYNVIGTSEFTWRYRIDEGSGFGQWAELKPVYRNWAEGYGETLTFTSPIETTGTVEIGFFAWASSTTRSTSFWTPQGTGAGDEFVLSGGTSAVPEPSTYALIIIGGMAVVYMTRRRKAAVNP